MCLVQLTTTDVFSGPQKQGRMCLVQLTTTDVFSGPQKQGRMCLVQLTTTDVFSGPQKQAVPGANTAYFRFLPLVSAAHPLHF
jgi:hypothetical protein